MTTPLAGWGAQLEEWERQGQAPVRDVYAPPVRPMSANPDAPIDSGGTPFWARFLQSWPGSPLTGSKALATAGDGARQTVADVKAGIQNTGLSVANAASSVGNRIIIIMVLALIGFLLVNRAIARAGA